jgi:polysaccharide export outer membrane protein
MAMSRLMLINLLCALTMALPGCAEHRPELSVAEANRAVERGYMLGPGDHVRITVFGEEKLNGEFAVSDTGSIAFPLIGVVPAKNQNTDQLAAAIGAKLSDGFVTDPKVSVEVVTYRPFYILGEVSHPGLFPYASSLTAQQAIATAGGFTYRANRKLLFITRNGKEGEQSVKLDGRTIYIMPGDTIRVGERYF